MWNNHPDYLSLLRGVIQSSQDDAPRLVLADWLEEHSGAERAEFIRVQCELANTLVPTDTRMKHIATLRSHERYLLRNHWDEWCPALKPNHNNYTFKIEAPTVTVLIGDGPNQSGEFRRGFICAITCPGSELTRVVDVICPDLEQKCSRCEGTGHLSGWDSYGQRIPCFRNDGGCEGKGTVPRVLTGQEQPVREIRLTSSPHLNDIRYHFTGDGFADHLARLYPHRRWALILPDDTVIEPAALSAIQFPAAETRQKRK